MSSAPAQHAPDTPESWLVAARPHIPNTLTAARFLLAALFVWLVSTSHSPWARAGGEGLDRLGVLLDESTARLLVAAFIFTLAALTDTLDGQLARRWGVQSRLGRIMDPLADKVLVLGGFVLLAGPAFAAPLGDHGASVQLSGVEPWMVIVILTREMLVTSIRGLYEGEGFDFSAGWAGKLKMVAQSLAVPAILLLIALTAPVPGSPSRAWVLALAWGTTAITALSAWPYLHRAYLASTGRIAPKARAPETPRREPDLGKPVDRVEIPAARTRNPMARKRGRSPPAPRRGSA